MKNKIFLRIAVISAFPLFISAILNMCIAMEYLGESSIIDVSKLNHPFTLWVSIIASTLVSITIASILWLSQYSDDIADLDAAKKEYYNAKKEMEVARDKYTELLKK